MSAVKIWLEAFRLRTLPLSLSCILMGSFLAYDAGHFKWTIFLLSILTTVLLQILSNLSNDYGDSVHGADNVDRRGPSRSVQTGAISATTMKRAMGVFVVLTLVSGLGLLWAAFSDKIYLLLIFLALGIMAIIAAITYTSGKRPYGYKGFGDISVLVFFGIVGVGGTYFLQVGRFEIDVLLPALSCGLMAVGVLNINNIRDIESDQLAGKRSIPVRLGREKAVVYHAVLLIVAVCASLWHAWLNYVHLTQLLFLLVLPLIMRNIKAVRNFRDPKKLDPYLKQLALTTLLFVILFGIGLILSK